MSPVGQAGKDNIIRHSFSTGRADLEEALFHSEDSTILNTAFVERHNLNGKFRLWYSGASTHSAADPQNWDHAIGYAESEDGVNWVKPILYQVEHKGSRANNIVGLDYRG